jgi:hypothetical protein
MAKKFSLKGLFFEETETGSETTDTPVSEKSAPTARPVPQSAASGPISAGGIEDPQIRDSLLKALEDANQEGYDYFEFAKAVEQQKSFVESEQIRFQTTHAAASVMGVTPEKLVGSAQFYLGILNQKEKEFLTALDQNKLSQVDQKKKEIQTIEANIAQRAEQINRLTQEINDLQQKKVRIAGELSASEQKIETVRGNFYSTLKAIVGRVSADIEKIKKYLIIK